MRSLRLLLTVALAVYMTGFGRVSLAQETDPSPFSITLSPAQYATVKGNVGKFQALNWTKAGNDGGVGDISFVKNINKNLSIEADGSVFPKSDDNKGHLILKDGDLAFLKVDYNAFRKYYDNTGGVYFDKVSGTPWPSQFSGVKANSPDLQMDVSFLKVEAGVGPITDPFLDVVYQHNSKDGDKSLLAWAPSYVGSVYRKIGPAWQSVDDTSDTITLKEKKDIAGITIKGQQTAEIDYNHNNTFMQYSTNNPQPSPDTWAYTRQLSSQNEYIDAKLFGSGVRFEKWMLNDKTFAGFGYHYNHTHDTELMQNMAQTVLNGVVQPPSAFNNQANQSLWNYSHALEDEHVFTGNFNAMLTPNLAFLADGRYEHMGADGASTYYSLGSTSYTVPSAVYQMDMENHKDHEGEHVSLRYSGIAHTSLYAESDLEQQRNWTHEYYDNALSPIINATSSNFWIDRLGRTQKESWTVGGEVIPNRFFIFKTQVRQRWEDTNYDTISLGGTPTNQTFLDALSINSIEETSTLTWKPYHWVQNSLKYQFLDTVYNPQASAMGSGVGQYGVARNRMLSSVFTYDISVTPIDPLMLMLTYSHVESFVRTDAASQVGGATKPYIPTFNSGDNSWVFSSTYTPLESLAWTNSVCYTVASNYVDFTDGVPYGSDFRELNFSTGLKYKYHKWLQLGPTYELATYRDNPLSGSGNYTAHIIKFDVKFSW